MRNRLIPDREAQIKRPIYLEEHRQHSDPPSIADGLIQSLEVIWIVTVDLHLNESNKQVGYLKAKFMTMDRLMCCVFCTSRGYFIPFRLCSDPSDVTLQRPQWKVILATRNLELRPPPLTKNSPSTLMATKTHTHALQYKYLASCLNRLQMK